MDSFGWKAQCTGGIFWIDDPSIYLCFHLIISNFLQEDLQYFITYLLRCILNCEPCSWVQHPRFKWWPVGVPWSSIILSKKHLTPVSYYFYYRFFNIKLYSVNSNTFSTLKSCGNPSYGSWWSSVTSSMGALICSNFLANCWKWKVSSMSIIVTEPHPHLKVNRENCSRHSAMKTWQVNASIIIHNVS